MVAPIRARPEAIRVSHRLCSRFDKRTDAQSGANGPGRASGCAVMPRSRLWAPDRTRPTLAPLLAMMRRGETLMVVRLDRLVRPISHPSLAGSRNADGQERAVPVTGRSDRHHHGTGQMLVVGNGGGFGTRTRADLRTHQSGIAGSARPEAGRLQSGAERQRP
jgi:hypothetical protein